MEEWEKDYLQIQRCHEILGEKQFMVLELIGKSYDDPEPPYKSLKRVLMHLSLYS